ncbi:phosphohydrolase [Deltaproteobacteria bacterium]|nr:phosphohydrolase [Deltaproteobacteria bacterium]
MNELQDAWLDAWRFAARAHGAQATPGEPFPYLMHLGAVGMEVLVAHQISPFDDPILAIQCALLHDTLEDTATREEGLVSRFGPRVAAGVRALAKDASLPTKAEKMADSLARIRVQPREVWAVKLADRITNLAPPPYTWSAEKIVTYREESRLILAALGEAHGPLAERLASRIEAYPPVDR